jgi:antitoxin MazE
MRMNLSNMKVGIRPIGSSKSIVLPKSLLARAGLSEAVAVEMTFENGLVVMRKAPPLRAGWAEAARMISCKGDDELMLGEFGNELDAAL